MSSKTVLICDRCGKILDWPTTICQTYHLSLTDKFDSFCKNEIDICEECANDYQNFIETKKNGITCKIIK